MVKFLFLNLTLVLIAHPVLAYLAGGSIAQAATVHVNNQGTVVKNSVSATAKTGSVTVSNASGTVTQGNSRAEVTIQQSTNGVEQEPLVIIREASTNSTSSPQGGESVSIKAESRVENGSSSKRVEIKIGGNLIGSSSDSAIASSTAQSKIQPRLPERIRQSLQNIINKFRTFFNFL